MGSRSYIEEETRGKLDKELKEKLQNDIALLYKAKCINWTGLCKDTKRPYSEVIAEYLLSVDGFDIRTKFSQLSVIPREKDYIVAHTGKKIGKSNRFEENLAKGLVRENKTLGALGNLVDYQIPLKSKRSDRAGKIDLVSISANAVHCIELKAFGN